MDLALPSTANLLRYFGQVLIVIAAAEIGVRVIRPSSACVRLVYWRLVIAACLLLPLLPIRSAIASSATAASAAAIEIDIAALARLQPVGIASQVLASVAMRLLAALPSLLLAGAIARAAWLGLGFLHLRRLRAGSRTLPLDTSILALTNQLAPHAELRWHQAATQPITFGLRHPLVLLPPRVADLPSDAQRAIVCHELLHVARRDWAWTLLDEAIQTALWWHPAIWWALAQVQLQREEVIDARVVALTAARQPYMRALMLFADATPAPAAAAAIPFIRRRHLAARLRQLAQEVPMSRLRLACVTIALAAILAAASWTSVSALPLQSQQAQQQQSPDQPVKLTADQKPEVITKVNPEYPKEALDARVEGEVVLDMTIAEDGTIADVRVKQGIPMLNKASTDAARKWKFKPIIIDDKNVKAVVTITMRFALK